MVQQDIRRNARPLIPKLRMEQIIDRVVVDFYDVINLPENLVSSVVRIFEFEIGFSQKQTSGIVGQRQDLLYFNYELLELQHHQE